MLVRRISLLATIVVAAVAFAGCGQVRVDWNTVSSRGAIFHVDGASCGADVGCTGWIQVEGGGEVFKLGQRSVGKGGAGNFKIGIGTLKPSTNYYVSLCGHINRWDAQTHCVDTTAFRTTPGY